MEFQFALQGDVMNLRACLQRNIGLVNRFAPESQQTLLYNAVWSGRADCVAMLIDEFGANVNQPSGQYFSTPLHVAVYHGNADIVRLLLDRGAQPLENSLKEYPIDMLNRDNAKRNSDMARVIAQLLRERRVDRSSLASTQVQQVLLQQPQQQMMSYVAPQHRPQEQQARPQNAMNLSHVFDSMFSRLPRGCQEFAAVYRDFSWKETPVDFVATGFLPYVFREVTYFTPMIFFASKYVVDESSPSSMFRAMVELDNLKDLMVSMRATYIEPLSGAIRPQPPFLYGSFLDYAKKVVALFEGTPPLVDKNHSNAATSKRVLSFDKWVEREISSFCDGALQYQSATHSITGVIPLFPGGSRTFKPLACVPVKIILDMENVLQAPMIFVVVTPDSDFSLVRTSCVQPSSGQVNLPCIARWTESSTIRQLLGELQAAFIKEIPIQPRESTASPLNGGGGASSSSVSFSAAAQATSVTSSTQQVAPTASPADPDEALCCVICMTERKSFVALPCRHLLFCSTCVESFKNQKKQECPLCRKVIEDYFAIFT